MAELVDIFNSMTKRTNWDKITDDEKEKSVFIFNRLLSKKYIEQSQLLNLKSIDKVSSMNIWYEFMKTQPYPRWFWSKSSKSEKDKVNSKDFHILLTKLNIKPYDLNYLIDKHYDFVKDELNYLKKLNTI